MAVPTIRNSSLVTLINQGTANWVGSGEIDLFAGSTFTNAPDASFNEQTNDEIWSDVGVGEEPSGLFDNQGTFVLDGRRHRHDGIHLQQRRPGRRSDPAPGS